jgi:hypothetical protein
MVAEVVQSRRASRKNDMADRKLTGSSGEHYVCYALARQGWIASLTRDGLERSDILAVNAETRRMIDRWDLLRQSTKTAPVLLPPWIRKRAQEDRVGLPEGHPWRKNLPDW